MFPGPYTSCPYGQILFNGYCYDLIDYIDGLLQGPLGIQTNWIDQSLTNTINSLNNIISYQNAQLSTYLGSAISSGVYSLQSQNNAMYQALSQLHAITQGKIDTNIQTIISTISGLEFRVQNHIDQSILQTEQHLINGITFYHNQTQQDLDRMEGTLNAVYQAVLQGINVDALDIGGAIGSIIGDPLGFIKDAIDDMVAILEGIWDGFTGAITGVVDDIQDRIKGVFRMFSDEATGSLDELKVIYQRLLAGEYDSWDEFTQALEMAGTPLGLTKFALGVLAFVPFLYNVSNLITYPALSNLTILTQEKAGDKLIDFQTILEAYQRLNISESRLNEELSKQGFNDERRPILKALIEKLPDEGAIRLLFLRHMVTDSEHDRLMTRLGYKQDTIDQLKVLYRPIPPVQDLITMSVREVFTPAIAEKYGLREDFPSDFLEWARQQGLADEWAINYWAAHWQLPSPMQANEMFHRRIIDGQELQELYKALDYMPYWRPKLLELSYNPLTRVDVRRMHKLGVLTVSQVRDSYLDIGYSPTNADLMTEFTIRYNQTSEGTNVNDVKDLSRSVVERAYVNGFITLDDAIDRLIELGYTEPDSMLLLSMVDYGVSIDAYTEKQKQINERKANNTLKAYGVRALSHIDAMAALFDSGYSELEAGALLDGVDLEYELARKEAIVKEVTTQYVEFTMDDIELTTLLTLFDFSAIEIERLLDELNVARLLRGRKPSLAEVRKGFDNGVLSPDDFVRELRGLGYPDKYVYLLLVNSGFESWDSLEVQLNAGTS